MKSFIINLTKKRSVIEIKTFRFRNTIQIVFFIFVICLLSYSIDAKEFRVDRTDDDPSAQACDNSTANDCSLRGAIIAANSTDPIIISDIVEIINVSTNNSYSLTTAETGATSYIDRDYTITNLSAALSNSILIQTANEDKYVDVENHLTLQLYKPVTAYVCYDKRATTLPTWLNDGTWTQTSESISTTDTLAAPMKVFKKSVVANETLVLGGNKNGGGTPADSNYFVIITPQDPEVFNVISILGGVYPLTSIIDGTEEERGDLDVTRSVIITSDTDPVVIDGGGIDRVFHIRGPGITVIIKNLTIQNGNISTGGGGGIFNDGQTILLKNSTIYNNIAGMYGGGIYNASGTLEIEDSIISENTGDGSGGIFALDGTMEIKRTTVSGNSAPSSDGNGILNTGGIGSQNTKVSVIKSAIYLNSGDFGGGIGIFGGSVEIVNSTIGNNTAKKGGGGLFNSGGLVNLINCTVYENGAIPSGIFPIFPGEAVKGGGIYNDDTGGMVTLTNTILAGNTSYPGINYPPVLSPDCFGNVQSEGHNIIGNRDGCNINIKISEGDIVGNPLLDDFIDSPIAGNGHFSLNSNSLAIDTANDNKCPAKDQLDNDRVDIYIENPICDKGAIEFQKELPSNNVTPTTNNQIDSTRVNIPLDINLDFVDPDGPVSSYEFKITDLPDNGTLTGSGPNHTYTPNKNYTGSDSFKWRVNDGGTDWSNEAIFFITVTAKTL
jgi:hypothetical protein